MNYATIIVMLLSLLLGSCSKGPVLYVFNWSDYIDPELIAEFEKEYGCKVKYSTYDSNENMLTKIKSSRESFDLVFPSGDHVSIMIENGLAEKLDKAKLTNIANLDTLLMAKANEFDAGNQYSLPYFWGITGLLYNKQEVPVELVAKQSWNVIGDQFFSGKRKITMLDDAREVVGAAMISNGYDVNDTSEEALAAALTTLQSWDGNITQFDSESYKRSGGWDHLARPSLQWRRFTADGPEPGPGIHFPSGRFQPVDGQHGDPQIIQKQRACLSIHQFPAPSGSGATQCRLCAVSHP